MRCACLPSKVSGHHNKWVCNLLWCHKYMRFNHKRTKSFYYSLRATCGTYKLRKKKIPPGLQLLVEVGGLLESILLGSDAPPRLGPE
jgi:hypothetical protein